MSDGGEASPQHPVHSAGPPITKAMSVLPLIYSLIHPMFTEAQTLCKMLGLEQ